MSLLDLEHLPLRVVDYWTPSLEKLRKDRIAEADQAAREAASGGR